MNFLEKEFSSLETIGLDDLNAKLPNLDVEIDECKKDISVYLDSVSDTLAQYSNRNKTHTNAIRVIKQDLDNVKDTLNTIACEDLKTAEETYGQLANELNEVNECISVLHVVCEIHERLEALRKFCASHTDYAKAHEVIEVLKVLLDTLPTSPLVSFIEELRKMINSSVTNAYEVFKKEFSKSCVLIKEGKYAYVKVPKDLDVLHSLLPVIYKNLPTRDVLKNTSTFLWDNVFSTVIKYDCTVFIKEEGDLKVLLIEKMREEANESYETVYNNLLTITQYFDENINCTLDGETEFLNFIGDLIKEPLAESVLKHCILKSIPSDWKRLDEFDVELRNSTEHLKQNLIKHNLVADQWIFIDKIRTFFIQKRCQHYSEKCRELMKKDLHNVIEVGTPYDSSKPLMEINSFLRCSISAYIPQLIEVAKEIIDEISEGPYDNRRDLFSTYKGIFFNYADFVATHHQKLLETIPQQVALFYNNCKYLSEQLKDWDELFEENESFKELCDDSAKAFYQVEEVGRMFFNSFVDEQKKQIETILKETHLQNRETLDRLEENTEKLIRQCLRQQELLKTVWSKVLSYPVYNETIGEIFNSMCAFLVNSLVVVEDIEAAIADSLIEIFKVVLNRGPKLFTDSNEVSLYVPQWYKFNELVFILGSSLLDINDRWADGKGPLALQFKPYELKQLIRALFQYTERRDAVLAKIHD